MNHIRNGFDCAMPEVLPSGVVSMAANSVGAVEAGGAGRGGGQKRGQEIGGEENIRV